MHMQRILPADPAQTTGKTKEHLDQLQKKFHRVPNMHAAMANAPAHEASLNDYLHQQWAFVEASPAIGKNPLAIVPR